MSQLSPKEWIQPVTLEGRGVRLEPLEARHAAGLLAAASPDLFVHTPQGPADWSLKGFEADIERVRALPDVVPFAVIAAATEEVLGRTTYMDIRPRDRGVEIGRTWLARRVQGTAINPEMKLLMLRHAFEVLGAVRVQLITGMSNRHSQRAIAKLGAVREGVLRRDRILPNGRVRDSVVFSIIREEWPVVRAGLVRRLAAIEAAGT